MRRFIVLLAGLVVLLAVPAMAQSPRELVERAAKAMGSADALRQLRNVTSEYSSVTYGLGQEETPYAPAVATIGMGRWVIDHANQRRLTLLESRAAIASVPNTRQRVVYANDVVVTETNGTAAPDLRGAALAVQQRTMRTYPDRLVLSALDNPSALSPAAPRTWRREVLRGVHFALGPDTLDLYFDGTTGLPSLSVQFVDDPVLGDRTNVTAFARWTPSGAVKFPRQIDLLANDRPVQQLTIQGAETNAALADSTFAVQADVASRSSREVLPPAPIVVTLTDLTNGTWHVTGGSHNSLLVEQPKGLVLVEAPLGTGRIRAVLDTLASRFPGKPVQLVVVTHHHFDHSGGLREVLARGIPVIVHERNAAFVEAVGKARKSIAPDRLSKGGRVVVRTLRDTLTIGAGASRVQLFALSSAHVAGLLAAYVPASQVVFTSDVVNPQPLPAALPAPGSRELVAFGEQRGLPVRSYAGGHGRVVAWDELQAAARP